MSSESKPKAPVSEATTTAKVIVTNPKVVVTKPVQPRLITRMFRPIGNVFSKGTVFLLGVGFSYFMFYSHFMNYLKKSDELIKNEIHNLKRIIESQAKDTKNKI